MENKMTTFDDITNTLWKAAGTFRGVIDAANYKDFILSMLFLKYLDDTYKEYIRNLEVRYGDNLVRIERAKKNLPFTLMIMKDLIICMIIVIMSKSVR